MQLRNIPLDDALGAILVHNITGADGRKVLAKGRQLNADDIAKIRALGKTTVYAAMLEPGDVREDDAATRLARTLIGNHIEASKPSGGRINLYANHAGFLRVNRDALKRINELDGVTLATILGFTRVAPKKMIATLKTVGLALPEATLRTADDIGAVLSITPVARSDVAIVLTGSENARARVEEIFLPPLRARFEDLGARVIAEAYVDEDADALAGTLGGVIGGGAQLVVIAGETSIMDANDVTPRGIQNAGGMIEVYGAPVEPGNLLLLAYKPCEGLLDIPIIGAPGCVKSRETNVVDLLLPPLLVGERVTRADVNALAEGGLLIG
ncbi:MAG: molybdopterin-binding protein [Chloroflexi bacterium]|nr:molybdopterin-binding protein [Chloroflexota bacterium]